MKINKNPNMDKKLGTCEVIAISTILIVFENLTIDNNSNEYKSVKLSEIKANIFIKIVNIMKYVS